MEKPLRTLSANKKMDHARYKPPVSNALCMISHEWVKENDFCYEYLSCYEINGPFSLGFLNYSPGL